MKQQENNQNEDHGDDMTKVQRATQAHNFSMLEWADVDMCLHVRACMGFVCLYVFVCVRLCVYVQLKIICASKWMQTQQKSTD